MHEIYRIDYISNTCREYTDKVIEEGAPPKEKGNAIHASPEQCYINSTDNSYQSLRALT